MCSVLCFPSVHTVPKKVAFIQRIKNQKEIGWTNLKYNWPLCTNGESHYIRKLLLSQIIPKNEELPNLSDNNYFAFSVPKKWPYQRKRLGKRVGGWIQLAFMYQRRIPQYPKTFTGSNHSQKRTPGPSWQTSQTKTASQSQPILSSTKKWGFHRCLQPPEAGLWQKVKGM